MANRGRTHDPEVFSIADLKEKASKKLPKMYRGKESHLVLRCPQLIIKEYFNEGAMDMITYDLGDRL